MLQVLKAKFNELVEKGNKLVLEQIVTTIASVADTAEEKFVEHYDKFMPCLKYMIGNATTPDLRLLRGKTIECVSLIGLAVGGEKFSPDASEVCIAVKFVEIRICILLNDGSSRITVFLSGSNV